MALAPTDQRQFDRRHHRRPSAPASSTEITGRPGCRRRVPDAPSACIIHDDVNVPIARRRADRFRTDKIGPRANRQSAKATVSPRRVLSTLTMPRAA